MSAVFADISASLDGYVAGPNQSRESGGETGPDDDVMREAFERPGAFVMGRNMFGGGPGPWDDDDPWEGWWGDEPPFRRPVFVVTHHAREPLHKQGGTTFTFVPPGDVPDLQDRGQTPVLHDLSELITMIALGKIVHPTAPSFADHFAHPGIRYVPIRDMPMWESALAWRRRESSQRLRAFACIAAATGGP